jgi:hypothetical protein
MDEMNTTYINNTFFAEAGPCSSTKNITICPNDVDLSKTKIFANSDYKTNKRLNLKINKCTGYSSCVQNTQYLNQYFRDKIFEFKLESDAIDLKNYGDDPIVAELQTLGSY